MQILDWLVIVLYLGGLLGVSAYYGRRVKNAGDMFAAGGQSPWWLSGLSGFMTMFSAGSFVVWGGIAYRYGLVAISISMCYGVAALLVGWSLAGLWRRLGVESAAEFLSLRFGQSIVQFYTWLQGLFGMFGMGLTIYGLSVIVCSLVPVGPDHPMAFLGDPETGRLSVTLTSIILCVFIVLITFGAGLWAVLVTDTLQFIVLTVSVVFVVPLIVAEVGGFNAFVEAVPEGFLEPTAGDFTWWFLLGWVVVHYFKIGGEWAFVQRFTCVPKSIAYTYFFPYDDDEALYRRFWSVPKDPRRAEPHVDVHLISLYHTNGRELVDQVRLLDKHMDKPIWGISAVSRVNAMQQGFTSPETTLSPRRLEQKLVLGAALGMEVHGLWPGRGWLDGQHLLAIGRAARTIWRHERFYFETTDVTAQRRVTPVGEVDREAWGHITHRTDEGSELTTLFNFTQRPLRFTLPGESGDMIATVEPNAYTMVYAP